MDINLYMPDANVDGTKIITSTSSKFSAVRIKRSDAPPYPNELYRTGLYFLLVGSDSVYVGESGLDTIGKRILKPHTGTIDASWHTVVGFPFAGAISKNELYYLENALCEYTYSHYPHCLTSTPAKANCNMQYRDTHYQLTTAQINSCKQYMKEIIAFIGAFGSSIFPNGIAPVVPGTTSPVAPTQQVKEFYFKNARRDVDGKAEIIIHCGNTGKRRTVLKAGSKVSMDVSISFRSHDSIVAKRQALESQGILVNRILQSDLSFDSQSGAGQFLNGTSFDGNSNWKTTDNDTPLKNLLV